MSRGSQSRVQYERKPAISWVNLWLRGRDNRPSAAFVFNLPSSCTWPWAVRPRSAMWRQSSDDPLRIRSRSTRTFSPTSSSGLPRSLPQGGVQPGSGKRSVALCGSRNPGPCAHPKAFGSVFCLSPLWSTRSDETVGGVATKSDERSWQEAGRNSKHCPPC